MILVINCGSSSAKYQLFDIRKWKTLAKGIVERIGERRQLLTHQRSNERPFKKRVNCPNHRVAIKTILDILLNAKFGVLSKVDQIIGIGHRLVHGGEEFKESVIVTEEVIKSIEKYKRMAPLHNPPSVSGIKACLDFLAGIPQVAVFDTSFHQTIPPHAFIYGLPYRFYKRCGIRRYGFHGTSHRFVSEEAARVLKKPLKSIRLITCHLGNGCSMTAVDRGRSVDTTMGFTPLEGLLMGTRSGDTDAAIVLYLLREEGLSSNRIDEILNKKSGLLGVSGISNDMRNLVRAMKSGSKRAKLAIEIFIYRIKKYIGAYQAALGGLDAVIFTGGIGENCPWMIKRISGGLRGVVGNRVKFIAIPTNEELLIAKDTYRMIKTSR